MRVFLVRAVLYLAFGVVALAALIACRHSGPRAIALVGLVYMAVLILVLAMLANYPRSPRIATVNAFADELEEKGLLVGTDFVAERAFRVEALNEQSGPHYFLKLEDGGVLHLCGTYLYDYEPVPGIAPRHFPCTRFTVRRHAELAYVVDILCAGIIIEPEVEAPPYSAVEASADRMPADGDILVGVDFDKLREERSARNLSAN
ncbi:MAG: hypothetical protein P4M01_04315 [Acidobacteriota bacterium]|nr:hypothetical protein [Acidobacteriota bacterium]